MMDVQDLKDVVNSSVYKIMKITFIHSSTHFCDIEIISEMIVLIRAVAVRWDDNEGGRLSLGFQDQPADYIFHNFQEEGLVSRVSGGGTLKIEGLLNGTRDRGSEA